MKPPALDRAAEIDIGIRDIGIQIEIEFAFFEQSPNQIARADLLADVFVFANLFQFPISL